MRIIGRIFLIGFAALGVLAFAGVTLGVVGLIVVSGKRESLPDSFALAIDLAPALPERTALPPLARLAGVNPQSLRMLVAAIDRAAEDARVAGLVLRLGQGELTFAQAQSLRAAIGRFGANGKPVFAFSENFASHTDAGAAYMLATAADEIWMQPSGDLGLRGIALEAPFFAEAMEDFGIEAQFFRRYQYKTAMNMFTESEMTESGRVALRALLDSWTNQLVDAIADSRGIDAAKVRALLDRGPFLSHEAVDAGLIDRLGYRDELMDGIAARLGSGRTLVSVEDYANGEPVSRPEPAARIAVIFAEGPIVDGPARPGPFASGQRVIAADDIVKQVELAAEDAETDAILLRIDSPGGSYVASDAIRRAIVRARADSGKPVVASMADVAASGGYFVAMAADRIVSQPATLTGSIGVVGGKLVLDRFWDRLDVNWERLQSGRLAGIWSPNTGFSQEERAFVERLLDRIYADFTTKAAADRGMDLAVLEKAARGRVWTGADAYALGLVDSLGGIDRAKAELRDLLELDAGAPLRLSVTRPDEPSIQDLIRLLTSGAPVGAGAKAAALEEVRAAALLRMVRPLIEAGAALRARGPQLRAAPVRPR